jgi:hypothetical protein
MNVRSSFKCPLTLPIGNYVISPRPRFAEIAPRGAPPAVFLADKRLLEYMRVRR